MKRRKLIKRNSAVLFAVVLLVSAASGHLSFVSKARGETGGAVSAMAMNTVAKNSATTEDERVDKKLIANYRKAYKEVLDLSEEMYAVNYLDTVEEALEVYETLSDSVKASLKTEQEKLTKLKNRLTEMKNSGVAALPERAKDDYSTITEDFENGLTKWSSIRKGYSEPEIVTDEDGNKVLKLTALSLVGLNSFSYPENAFVKRISYRMKINEKENTYGIGYCANFPLGYVDDDNYAMLRIWRDTLDKKFGWRRDFVSGGTGGAAHLSTDVTQNFYGKWLNVTIDYTENGKATVQVKADGSETTDIAIAQSLVNGKAALWGMGHYKFNEIPTYFDDVVIELQKGEFDVDEEREDVVVYYSGNTGVQGDDVVTLVGEDLYNTLSRAYIVKLPDDATAAAGYVKQMNYNTLGTESAYIKASAAKTVWAEVTAESEPLKLELLQLDDTQVKFIIPSELGKGIFAVKLEGFNLASEEDDVVLLLNTPKISFFQGTDAAVCNPGGTMRIVGENLALYDMRRDEEDYIEDTDEKNEEYKNNSVQVLVQNESGSYTLSGEAVNVKAEQYVYATLPADIPEGEYEVMLYNGFGNGACWSMPCETKLTVGPSPYESWPTTVFNVREFGATGEREQNATGYVIDALTAAAENGGGIVYFPKGIYNLIHSIIIPEKVQVIGDGPSKSVLLYTPDQWVIGDIPTYLLAASGNIRIKNIGFSGSRSLKQIEIKNGKETAENVYIENVELRFEYWAGSPSNAQHSGTGQGYYELQNIVSKECSSNHWLYVSNGYNIQLKDIYVDKRGDMLMGVGAEYLYADHLDMGDDSWGFGGQDYTIYEYCNWRGSTCGVTGRGLLFYGCKIADRELNNRELYVADGSPSSNGVGETDLTMWKDTGDPTGCTYIIRNWERAKDKLVGYQVYVNTGQGTGQVRAVVANEGDKIVVDSPFVVEPNRNGTVTVRSPRESIFFVNGRFHNGSSTGFFGGAANVIYNHCVWSKVFSNDQNAYGGDVIWYVSYNRGYCYDPYNRHTYGTGASAATDATGFGRIRFICGGRPRTIIGFCMRGSIYDGYSFELLANGQQRGLIGFTFDKNVFSDVDYAISNSYAGQYVQGILMYKNVADDVIALNAKSDMKNHIVTPYGCAAYIEYENQVQAGNLQVGDINGDGEITLRDCTMIKLYLTGQTTLDEDALRRADFFADDEVTLRDATAILHYITTGQKPEPAIENGGYFDGNF